MLFIRANTFVLFLFFKSLFSFLYLKNLKKTALCPTTGKNRTDWKINYSKMMKVESEKVGLKLNIQKTKIMASGPITSWQIDGETVETVADFILGGSKIIADGDWSHEIKRCLLLGRKAVTNLDSILESRGICWQMSI